MAEDFPQPGLERSLAQQRAQQISDVVYSLQFSIPAQPKEPATAAAEISFLLRETGHPVVLDFKEASPAIQNLLLNGRKVEFTLRNQHLILKDGVKAGSNLLSLNYKTKAAALNRNADFMYTLFVPDRASQAFPCFDQPDIKARFNLKLSVPEGWIAVGNEKITASETNNKLSTFTFATTPPLSTYLFAFAAGKFQVLEGPKGHRRMKMYFRETDSDKVARNQEAIFSLTREALHKLEAYTAMPYPFSKFEMLLIPAMQFGGMEHPGAIFYNEGDLMLDASASINQIMGRAGVIAHEVAHMWFGDLVTMRWFDDVWLKEVMANLLASKVTEPLFPKFNHDLKFYLAHAPGANDIDRSEGTHPIRQKLENLQDAGSLYGGIIYLKSAIVMKQLEGLLSADAFRDGIREYLQTFKYANATWDDLLHSLQKQTKLHLKEWSHAWIDEAGRPEVRFTARASSLVVEQIGRVWPQTFGVSIGQTTLNQKLSVDLKTNREVIQISQRPRYVLGNSDGTGYGFFHLDSKTQDYLLKNLPKLSDPLARATAWSALWDELYDGKVEPLALADLALRAIPLEKDQLVTEYALGRFRQLYWVFLQEKERLSIVLNWEKMLWAQLNAKGHAELQPIYWNTLVAIALSPGMLAQLEKVWNGELQISDLALSESDQIHLALNLALKMPKQSSRILTAQTDRIKNTDRLAEFQFVKPALSADEKLRREFFLTLKDPARRQHERWVEKALQFLAHPVHHSVNVMIDDGLDWLQDIQRTGTVFFPSAWLSAILGRQQSPEIARKVRTFLNEHPSYPADLRGKILQAADPLFRAAKRNKQTQSP